MWAGPGPPALAPPWPDPHAFLARGGARPDGERADEVASITSPPLSELDAALGGVLSEVLAAGGFEGKPGQRTRAVRVLGAKAAHVALAGVGKREKASSVAEWGQSVYQVRRSRRGPRCTIRDGKRQRKGGQREDSQWAAHTLLGMSAPGLHAREAQVCWRPGAASAVDILHVVIAVQPAPSIAVPRQHRRRAVQGQQA